jgi:hypothetical protein
MHTFRNSHIATIAALAASPGATMQDDTDAYTGNGNGNGNGGSASVAGTPSSGDLDRMIADLQARKSQVTAEEQIANREKAEQYVAEKHAQSHKPQAEVPVPGVDLTENVPVGHVHVGDGSAQFPHNVVRVA